MLLFASLLIGSSTVSSQGSDPWVSIITPLSDDVLNDNSIYIGWEGDAVAYYAVELDGSGFENVGQETEMIYHSMAGGEHVFRVKGYGDGGGSYVDSVRFTVDRVRPGMLAYGPTGTEVSVRSNITFTFSEMMDVDTVNIEIYGLSGEMMWADNSVTLYTALDLEPDIGYQVTVQGKDLAGNDMAPFRWSFLCIDRGIYMGHVVDLGGRPIPNVRIDLQDNSTILTDQDGAFTIGSKWGAQVLEISKDGFHSREVEVFVEADNVVYGDPIQLDRAPSEQGLNMNAVFVVLILALLLSAFVLFAVVKVGRDTGLLPEE